MHFTAVFLLASAISFQDLAQESPDQYIGKQIEIRGFPYQSESGDWILAGEPQLKSCCVGSPQNAKKQIWLDHLESKLPLYQAISVSGELSYYNGRYTLSHVQLIDTQTHSWKIISVAAAACLGCLMVLYFIRRMLL